MEWADVHIESVRQGNRIRLRPLPGQRRKGRPVPRLWISGSKRLREQYPLGTIFIADLQLVQPERSGDYLKIRPGHELQLPVEGNVKRDVHGQLIIFDNSNQDTE